jgi:MSHA pilin protein MshD
MCTIKPRGRCPSRGFTLLEIIVFIVVVSVGVTGILMVMNTTTKSSADPMVRKQTLEVTESLLEEILLKEYAKPAGGSTSGLRKDFDCVDDYNGYSSATAVDIQGNAIAGLSGYSITPAVSVALSADLTGVTAKKVIVSVTGPQGVITLMGYRSNY